MNCRAAPEEEEEEEEEEEADGNEFDDDDDDDDDLVDEYDAEAMEGVEDEEDEEEDEEDEEDALAMASKKFSDKNAKWLKPKGKAASLFDGDEEDISGEELSDEEELLEIEKQAAELDAEVPHMETLQWFAP